MKRVFTLFAIVGLLSACNNAATVDERATGVTIDSTGVDSVPTIMTDTVRVLEGGKKLDTTRTRLDTSLVPLDTTRKR